MDSVIQSAFSFTNETAYEHSRRSTDNKLLKAAWLKRHLALTLPHAGASVPLIAWIFSGTIKNLVENPAGAGCSDAVLVPFAFGDCWPWRPSARCAIRATIWCSCVVSFTEYVENNLERLRVDLSYQ
jgi:hypothetical protein